jgi:hypothetical protein
MRYVPLVCVTVRHREMRCLPELPGGDCKSIASNTSTSITWCLHRTVLWVKLP